MHTDMRASERVEFDQQIAAKLNILEQYKAEKELEEEIKRLRKELVPKAQPMYFDRPFVHRRSTKNPTIPREPMLHIPQHKKIKSCLSWNDLTRSRHHRTPTLRDKPRRKRAGHRSNLSPEEVRRQQAAICDEDPIPPRSKKWEMMIYHRKNMRKR